MNHIRIAGTGSYLPPKRLTNQDLADMGLDVSDEWIVQRTGIHERRIAGNGVTTSDLAVRASQAALAAAGIKASAVDLIIVATITPDTSCPSAANWLQAKLDAPQAISFDIAAACSGFIFGLNVAQQYIRSGTCRCTLVVAAEVMSRTLDWSDRSTCILWGDGAGAAVLVNGEEGPKLLSTHVHTDGANGRNLLLPGGGSSTTPISHESVDRRVHTLNMIQANRSFKIAVKHFMAAIKEGVHHNQLHIDDIDWFIPHQANTRMFHSIAEQMKIPFEKFYLTLHKYGNISSASCAIALDEAAKNSKFKTDDLICLPVFGGGLTWGSTMVHW